MKITDDSKKKFIRNIHQNIDEDTTTEEYEALVMNTRDRYLMKAIRTKMVKHNENETEKIWFNKDIEQAIKLRKLYNRQRRNEQDQARYEELSNLYI